MGPDAADSSDPWLGACRSAAGKVRTMLAGLPTTAERAAETGERGGGGDRTLVIDRAAEDVVLAELDGVRAAGERFTVVSEERGELSYGGDELRVVIDPIDGSLNAKRGMLGHALSVAVADGPTVGDAFFGYVYDLGAGEEWVARRGAGAWLDGRRLDPRLPERRTRDGRLEILAIESADPRWVAASMEELVDQAHRLRAIGAIALALCQVAAARADGMVSLRACRSFDAAAGALIVREAGGHVAFPRCAEPLGMPLDLGAHSPVVAARTPGCLAALASVPT